jgi:D-alanyl-D-alanine carboxypeptidase/D-alanyl-D-alanine-endopeptidase (penicillin-binding protein 4)
MSFYCLLFTLALASSTAEFSWANATESVIQREIAAIDAEIQDFGIWIKRGDQVVGLNESQPFVPASLSKIPTALTFLQETTMDQKFKTWIYHSGEIRNGVLQGDLYLKGGGDPTLVTESMWLMVNKLKRDDIKEVKGQLYVDETYFDNDYYSEGRQKRRVDRAYDAPVSALSFNWNAVSIYVRPGQKAGQPARVYTSPDLPMIQVNNKATTKTRGKTDVAVKRRLQDGKILIDVTGAIPLSEDEKAFYKSVGDAALWTGASFAQLLNRAGIQYQGDVKKKKTPESAKQLVEHEGWSVARVLAALSKFSNNFVAEMITKHLGRSQQQPGNIDDGLEKIVQYLQSKKWPSSAFTFVNPSGFTRSNRMRADLLGQLLDSARSKFDSAPEFMASLPISGTDGTLKSRMKQVMKGKVRAKTGYLSGVVGLAGYMETRSGGEPITFVFMYNGPYKKDWDVRAMFNRILWRVYQKS